MLPQASALGTLALAFALTSCAGDRLVSGDDDVESESESTSTESTSTETTSTESSSESSEVDTDDSLDDTANTSLSFYAGPDVDFGNISSCDPFAQDCPDGEKCVPYASSGGVWDLDKCVPIMGDGQAGDPCISGGIIDATDDCDGDSLCWDVMDVDGQLMGVCTPFCGNTADDPLCDPGSSCLIAYAGSVTLCLPDCDPLLQNCDPGLGCFWTGTSFGCTSTTSDIPTGEPCGYINDCAAGNYCANAADLPDCADASCCASFCDLADPVCSVMGTQCVPFFEQGMAPRGFDDVGVCIVPP